MINSLEKMLKMTMTMHYSFLNRKAPVEPRQFVILSEAKDLKIRKCLIAQRRIWRSFVASLLRMTSGFGLGLNWGLTVEGCLVPAPSRVGVSSSRIVAWQFTGKVAMIAARDRRSRKKTSEEMQNAECKMQNILHSAFCILHFRRGI